MKKLVVGILCAIFSAGIMAANGNHPFTERTVQKELGQYTVYEVKLNDEQVLAFVVNDKDKRGTARLLTRTGKVYRVLSANYCVDETDNCWTSVLYNESLANFSYWLGEYRKKYELSWSIDYIDGNELKYSGLTDIPQLGALSEFENADEMDSEIPDLVWDIDPSNYQ